MVAFSQGGDWTWTGTSTFSGAVSIPDLESTTLNINTTTVPSTTNIGSNTALVNVYLRADDLQIEALGNMRFDSAFGGSGNCNIASSNSTHLQLGNSSCAQDVTATTMLYSISGLYAVNSATEISLQIGGSSILDLTASLAILSHGSGTTQLGNTTNPTNIYASNMDFYCAGGNLTINASTQIILGGALSNAIALGDASVVPQVLAFNSPRTFVNSPSFDFQTSSVDLSQQGTASSSGLKNVMMNLSGKLVVSTVVNPSQPFWTMGGNASGLPIFGTTAAATGITMRTGVSSTFLSIIGANGNMTLENQHATGTTAFTSIGVFSIDNAATGTQELNIGAVNTKTLIIGTSGATVASVVCSEFNVNATLVGGGIGVVNIGAELAINMSAPQTNVGDDAFVTALTLGQLTSAVTILNGLSVDVTSASAMNVTANTNATITSTTGSLSLLGFTDAILDSVDNTGRVDIATNNATAFAMGSSVCNFQITCSDVSSISSAGSFTIFTVGDFSAISSAGSGILTGSVDITVTAETGALSLDSQAGPVNITGSTLINLNSGVILMPAVGLQAGVVGVPAIVLPAGFRYVVADAGNQLYFMS